MGADIGLRLCSKTKRLANHGAVSRSQVFICVKMILSFVFIHLLLRKNYL